MSVFNSSSGNQRHSLDGGSHLAECQLCLAAREPLSNAANQVLLQIPWSLGVYLSHLHLQQCFSALMGICYPLSQCQAFASVCWRHGG